VLLDGGGQGVGPPPALRWTSNRPDVAPVDERGGITAGTLGHAIITAATEWGAEARLDVFVVGDLLVASTRRGVTGIYQALPDRPDSLIPILLDGAQNTQPAYSPDRTRIAFSSNRAARDGNFDLYVMDADGSGRRPLTSTPAQEGAPAWSPDGTQIAFESDRDGNMEIYVMDAGGQNVRRLTNNPAGDHSPVWSPDGKWIAFLSDRDRRPQSDVYLMGSDGKNIRRLTTSGQNWSPAFSPSGQEIAVQKGRDLEVLPVGGGEARRLTADPQTGMSPTWAPDGARIAFASTRNARLELFSMDTAGANQQLLLSMPGASVLDPRWSPDGTRIAFVYVPQVEGKSSQGQPYAIYVLTVATQKVTRLSP